MADIPRHLSTPSRTDADPEERRVLSRFRERTKQRRIAADLYGAIVTAARDPAIFGAGAVPDSPMGRLESILLHMSLVIERLQAEGPAGQALAQALAEAYVTDMDDSLREIGIGDMGVPRRVKQATGALFERHRAYAQALASAEPADLEHQIAANLLAGVAPEARASGAAALAAYARAVHGALARQPGARLVEAAIELPAASAVICSNGGDP